MENSRRQASDWARHCRGRTPSLYRRRFRRTSRPAVRGSQIGLRLRSRTNPLTIPPPCRQGRKLSSVSFLLPAAEARIRRAHFPIPRSPYEACRFSLQNRHPFLSFSLWRSPFCRSPKSVFLIRLSNCAPVYSPMLTGPFPQTRSNRANSPSIFSKISNVRVTERTRNNKCPIGGVRIQ
jgi:hypothetical protein